MWLVSEVSFFHFNPKLNILVPFLGFADGPGSHMIQAPGHSNSATSTPFPSKTFFS